MIQARTPLRIIALTNISSLWFLLFSGLNPCQAQIQTDSLTFFLNSSLDEKRLAASATASFVYTLAEEKERLQHEIEAYLALISKDHLTKGAACQFEISEAREPLPILSFQEWWKNQEATGSLTAKKGRFAFGFALYSEAKASQNKELFDRELPIPASYAELLDQIKELVTQNQNFAIPLGTLFLGEKFIDSLGQSTADFKLDLERKLHFPSSHLVLKSGFYGDPEHSIVLTYQNSANKSVRKPTQYLLRYFKLQVTCPLRKKPRKILVCDQESQPIPAANHALQQVATLDSQLTLLNEHQISAHDPEAFVRLKQDPVHLRLPLEQEQKLALEGWDAQALQHARNKNQLIVASLAYSLISCEDHRTVFSILVDYQVGEGQIENGYLHFVYYSTFYQGCSKTKEDKFEDFTYSNAGVSESWDVGICEHAHFEEEP